MADKSKQMEQELTDMEAQLSESQAQGEATTRAAQRLAEELKQMREANQKEIRKRKEDIFHWNARAKLYKETVAAYCEVIKRSTTPDLLKKTLNEGK